MKKIFSKTAFILTTFIVGLMGCEDDINYSDNESRVLNTSPVICIDHINPLTGLDYTEEEITALSYDPCSKEVYYDISAPIELAFVSDVKPLRVEIENASNYADYAILNDFIFEDGQYKSTFTANFADIGIEALGDQSAILFSAVYDLKEPSGDLTIVATTFSAKYSVFVDPNAVIPYVFFEKK